MFEILAYLHVRRKNSECSVVGMLNTVSWHVCKQVNVDVRCHAFVCVSTFVLHLFMLLLKTMIQFPTLSNLVDANKYIY